MKNVTGNATVIDKPADFLGTALALGGTSEAIKLQESLGAGDVRHTDRFPLKRNGVTDAQLRELGFVLGEKIDDLFQSVQLPPRWTKTGAGDLWTYVLDEHKRKRFSIFYKAAFYDRDAFANGIARFSVTRDYDNEEKTKKNVIIVNDGDKRIHCVVGKITEVEYDASSEAVKAERRRWYDEGRALEAEAAAWLSAKYPNWKDWNAHWND